MAQSTFAGAWLMMRPWSVVQRAFPGSLISLSQDHWAARYPAEWPERELWVVASDLDSRVRVVLTGDDFEGAHVALTTAVRASCAVPGVYAPVRVGTRRLVDGGVQSATNLDVAVRTQCRAVIALAPMGYDRREPPGYLRAMGRLPSNTKLNREVARVRRAGMAVLTVRPGAEEVRHQGFNIFSRQGVENVMDAAYETTARRLAEGAGQRVLDQIRAEAPAPA
jgi:NTE family protein